MNASHTLSHITLPASRASSDARGLAGSFRSALASPLLAADRLLRTWETRRNYRAQLSNLPEYLLRDVGLNVADAQREADKPFWRA